MKRSSAPMTRVTVSATLFVLGALSGARADEREPRGCSVASLQGSFGFTSTGTLVAFPPPLAGLFGESGGRTSTDKETLTAPPR